METTTRVVDGPRQFCRGALERGLDSHTITTYTTLHLADGRRFHYCDEHEYNDACTACGANLDTEDHEPGCGNATYDDVEPRTFAELAHDARDVQAKAYDMKRGALTAGRRAGVDRLAWQMERLAAQFAEACERLAALR